MADPTITSLKRTEHTMPNDQPGDRPSDRPDDQLRPRSLPLAITGHDYQAGHWGAATGSTLADGVLSQWVIRTQCARITRGSERRVLVTVAQHGAVFLPYTPDSQRQMAGWYVPATLVLATLTGMSGPGVPVPDPASPRPPFRIDAAAIRAQILAGTGPFEQAVIFDVEPRQGPKWMVCSVLNGVPYWGWGPDASDLTMGVATGSERDAVLRTIARPDRLDAALAVRPGKCDKNFTLGALA